MLYAYIPFEPNQAKVIQSLEKFGADVYTKHGPKVYFVSYGGTTQELSNALGLSDAEIGTGVVLSISNYWGFGPKDLWEWLALRANGS